MKAHEKLRKLKPRPTHKVMFVWRTGNPQNYPKGHYSLADTTEITCPKNYDVQSIEKQNKAYRNTLLGQIVKVNETCGLCFEKINYEIKIPDKIGTVHHEQREAEIL